MKNNDEQLNNKISIRLRQNLLSAHCRDIHYKNVPKEWIAKREGWENLSAVKNNKVYVFDDSWLNRPGPRLVVGLENLARVIHPECFS